MLGVTLAVGVTDTLILGVIDGLGVVVGVLVGVGEGVGEGTVGQVAHIGK